MSVCDSGIISDNSLLPEYTDTSVEYQKLPNGNSGVQNDITIKQSKSNKKATLNDLKAFLNKKEKKKTVENFHQAVEECSNLLRDSVEILDTLVDDLRIEETPEKVSRTQKIDTKKRKQSTSEDSDFEINSSDRSQSPEIPLGAPVIFRQATEENGRIILKLSMATKNRQQKRCTDTEIESYLNSDDSSDTSTSEKIFDVKEKPEEHDLKWIIRRSTGASEYKITRPDAHERKSSLRTTVNRPRRFMAGIEDKKVDVGKESPSTSKRMSLRSRKEKPSSETFDMSSDDEIPMSPKIRAGDSQKNSLESTPRHSSRKTKDNKTTETDDSPDTRISPKYTRSRSSMKSQQSLILKSVQATPSKRVQRSCKKNNIEDELEGDENDTNKENESEDSSEDVNLISRKRKLTIQDKIETSKKSVTIAEPKTPKKQTLQKMDIDDTSTRNKTPKKSNTKKQEEPVIPKTSRRVTKSSLLSGIKGNLTPSMKQRKENVARPKTILSNARAQLHVSAVPSSLPCREEEFNNIFTFLHGKLVDHSSGCIYISGVPGTGKTATVNEAIRCLKKLESKGELEQFDRLEINGMKLTEPRQAYSQILKQLTGQTMSWEQSHKFLETKFTKSKGRKPMTLLLVDELDLLCNRRQDVVYNLLDWPAKEGAQLVVITIANTMDLPERVLMGRVTSRLGLTRLTFQPYNHKQLQEIVETRLRDSEAFKSEAIQLVARKVAAVSGDARRALDICRRATEIAESRQSEMVVMSDVNDALHEMIASPKVQAIKHCSEMEKIFLKGVCAEIDRTGVEEVTFVNVYNQFKTLCIFDGLQIPNITQTLGICSRLSANRLLLCEHSRADILQRILLNVSADDIHFALKATEF